MLIRIAAMLVLFAAFEQRIASGQAHFKRFPATVTNDGAYVLGWGIKDDENGDVASKTEIAPDGAQLGEVESDTVEDYLVDTVTGKIVATIPDFSYYEGSEGRENHYHLAVGGRPIITAKCDLPGALLDRADSVDQSC